MKFMEVPDSSDSFQLEATVRRCPPVGTNELHELHRIKQLCHRQNQLEISGEPG